MSLAANALTGYISVAVVTQDSLSVASTAEGLCAPVLLHTCWQHDTI